MTHPTLPPDLLPRLTQLIMPLMSDEDERDAWLTQAFFLTEPRLYHQISRSGAPLVFVTRCVRTLLTFGCLPDRSHSLSLLLNTLRYGCGDQQQREIDTLLPIVNGLCRETFPPEPTPTTPAAEPGNTQTVDTPHSQRRPTVFISYSHQDTAFAQRLIADLNAAGHSCWIDTSEIKGGDEWIMTIAEGIINSYAFVPIVTLKALQSKWVQDEILWARQKDKLIIPVILENVLSETRFFPLISYQGVTVFDSTYAAAVPKLLSYLPNPALPAVAEPEPEGTQTPSQTPKRGVPRQLELAYLERLKLEELVNTEKYTPMGGESQVTAKRAEMRAVFELLPVNREQPAETRTFENAVAEIQRLRRCVLLGEPGGGKTTTMWKLADDLLQTAQSDRKAPVPILVRLGKWTDPAQPIEDFIRSQMGDLGDYLDELLAGKRVALLLDGLNEIPVTQGRDKQGKRRQVQGFIEAHPDVLAVVSCRELDYTIDLGFDKINITPLDPLRIREFAGRYLGEGKGNDLFWRIAGGADVKRTWESWQRAGASFDLFWTAEDIPRANPNVYGSTSGEHDRIWREKVRSPNTMMALARNPYMLLMLTSVYADEGELPANRGQLFEKFVDILLEREIDSGVMTPDERQPLIEGLLGVAYKMQMQSVTEGDDETRAQTVLSEAEVLEILDERRLYLAGSASILSVGDQVRFTHQLLQEYFAAKYMDTTIFAGEPRTALKAADIWPPAAWWERTNWEEAAILLAGLYSDDPTPVVAWLMEAQPEVAAQCITRSGADRPPPATLERLREAWLPRLTDLAEPVLARAAVGRALGSLNLDNRPGVGLRRDGLPDIAWCEVPAGEFIMGSDKTQDKQAGDDETPQQKVYLLDYHISKYPVTNAQFAAFIRDGGYTTREWWTDAGWKEKEEEGWTEPRYWHNSTYNLSNHPVVGISWYEAYAFCQWLNAKCREVGLLDNLPTDWLVRLPTESEWEKAARGTDGRIYPYGSTYDPQKANLGETGIGRPSAVGVFTGEVYPYGVLDMSGNVYDWCQTQWRSNYGQPEENSAEGAKTRVLRGGAFFIGHHYSRCAFRYGFDPFGWDVDLGFRVVCGAPY